MTVLTFHPTTSDAIPIHLLTKAGVGAWIDEQPELVRGWAQANAFGNGGGATLMCPGEDGSLSCVAHVMSASDRSRFTVAGLRSKLPDGVYRFVHDLDQDALAEAALGWLLAGYAFGRYKDKADVGAALVSPDGIDAARVEAIAAGETLTRDLINTPASDMGPPDLATAALTLAEQHGATAEVIVGEDLLAQNFPMVHTVGRAADRAPRLIDMRWGETGPRVTLVGKGVCFDTGGLNIKPGASMGLMKKDMGGAATVLGLAHMIMATGMKIQLRVLIPAVENAISGNAFRPQDILTSRKGLTVEINNTDAEGRLVLADALALADEEDTDLIVSMATLTGAARVAVGPDIAPFFTDDEPMASAIMSGAETARDPTWRLPFHAPYETMIEPAVADLDNAPKGGFGGAITAALFLRRFVENAPRYVHFDIYGWQPKPAPARPLGGVGQGARALFEALPKVLDL